MTLHDRKARTRRLIQLGGLIEIAPNLMGLNLEDEAGDDRAVLLGWLAELPEDMPADLRAKLLEKGRGIMRRRRAQIEHAELEKAL